MWLPLREVHIVRIGPGKILALPKIGLTAPLPPNLGTIVDLATKSAKFDSQFNFEKMFTIEGEWSTFFLQKSCHLHRVGGGGNRAEKHKK